MAKYSVQAPDGKVYVLEGPDGASQEDVLRAAQSLAQAHQTRAAMDYAKTAQEVNPATGGQNLEIGPFDTGIHMPEGLTNYVAGIGKSFTDLGRGVKERFQQASSPTMSDLVTGTKPEDAIAESRRLDAPLMATTAGKAGNITGKILPAIAANVLVPGAGGLLGSAAVGGTQGFLEPTTADESVLKNTVLGVAGGAGGYGAGKLIGAAVRTGRAAAEPFFQAGRQRIVGRALSNAAGADAPQVANRLAEASQPFVGPTQPGMARATLGEIVPGSVPTVGQAAGNAGIAALERSAVATSPDVTTQVSNRLTAQNAARGNVLQGMAGTDGARDMAVAARDGTADQLYGRAFADGVPQLGPEQLANVAAFQQRVPPDVLAYARRLAQIKGIPLDDTTSLQGMHWTKKALDALIAKESGPGADNALKGAYTGLKNDMVGGMSELSPEYAAASSVYRDMSAPVNQMDVAQAILGKSVNGFGEFQPAEFARSLTDATARRATGFSGATLDNTLSNQQNNQLAALLEDTARARAAQNLGRGAGSDTVQKLAYSNVLGQAGGTPGALTAARILSGVPVIGRIGSATSEAYQRANQELSNQLAQTLLNPGTAAAAMSSAARYDTPNPLLQLMAPYLLRGAASAPPAVALTMSR